MNNVSETSKSFSNFFYSGLKASIKSTNEDAVFVNPGKGVFSLLLAPLMMTILPIQHIARATFHLIKRQPAQSLLDIKMIKTPITHSTFEFLAGLGLLFPYVNKIFINHIKSKS